MKPKLNIEKVYVDEITSVDFPVYLRGYDQRTNQEFEGKFNYSNSSLKPISYRTSSNKELSPLFFPLANAFMKRAKEDYYQTNKE